MYDYIEELIDMKDDAMQTIRDFTALTSKEDELGPDEILLYTFALIEFAESLKPIVKRHTKSKEPYVFRINSADLFREGEWDS